MDSLPGVCTIQGTNHSNVRVFVLRGVDKKSPVPRLDSQTEARVMLLLNTSAYASPLLLDTVSSVRQHRQPAICSRHARTLRDSYFC